MIERIKEYVQTTKDFNKVSKKEERNTVKILDAATEHHMLDTSMSVQNMIPLERSLESNYCVVEGIVKNESTTMWGDLIVYHGALHVLYRNTQSKENELIKQIFLLKAVGNTPELCKDNLVCGDCILHNQKSISSQSMTKNSFPNTNLDFKQNTNDKDFLQEQRQKLSQKRRVHYEKTLVHNLVQESHRKKKNLLEKDRLERRTKHMNELRRTDLVNTSEDDENSDENVQLSNPKKIVASRTIRSPVDHIQHQVNINSSLFQNPTRRSQISHSHN
jgi:hypothetical protein